jgi:hypothetical protein
MRDNKLRAARLLAKRSAGADSVDGILCGTCSISSTKCTYRSATYPALRPDGMLLAFFARSAPTGRTAGHETLVVDQAACSAGRMRLPAKIPLENRTFSECSSLRILAVLHKTNMRKSFQETPRRAPGVLGFRVCAEL